MGKEQDLCDAAFKKDLVGVKKALDAGANPNCTDTPKKGGATPLWYAAINGQEEMIKMLVEKGASVDFKTLDGDTPLHGAASGGNMAVTKLLVKLGAHALVLNKAAETPALAASGAGWDEVSRYLSAEWMKDRPNDCTIVSSTESTLKAPKRTLFIHAVGAKNLTPKDSNGLSDPYMKIHIAGHEFKTKVINKNLNPEWNETFTVEIKTGIFLDAFKFEVYDKDLLSSSFEGGNTVDLTKPPYDLENDNLGRTVRCQIKLNNDPNAKKIKPVSGYVIFDFTVVDEELLKSRSEKEKAIMAEETAKWQKLLDDDKEEQKKALAKNPNFEKRFAKLGLKESYTRPLDVVNFIKPGDSVLRNIYSFVSEKNPMLGIWTSGIVKSIDKESLTAVITHNPNDEVEPFGKDEDTNSLHNVRVVDTAAKWEDIQVGDLVMAKPKGFIYSDTYKLKTHQWIYAEVVKKEDKSITIKYMAKKDRKEEEKTQTLEIDDAEFNFRFRIIFSPLLQTHAPVHPIFETIGYAFGSDAGTQIPRLKAWVKADKGALAFRNEYDNTFVESAFSSGGSAHIAILLENGVAPKDKYLWNLINNGLELEHKRQVMRMWTQHGGLINGEFLYRAITMYKKEEGIAIVDLALGELRASLKAQDDDIPLAADKIPNLGDKEAFHREFFDHWNEKDFAHFKKFIDKNYYPLVCTEIEGSDYGSIKYPNLVFAMVNVGKKDIADYLISKGASAKTGFAGALKFCALPAIKVFVEEYKLDVNGKYPFKAEPSSPLKIVSESYSATCFPVLKLTDSTLNKAAVYEYLFEKGAFMHLSNAISPSEWKGFAEEEKLGLTYPKKNLIDEIRDPILSAPLGGTIDMTPFLPAAVAKVLPTLPSHTVAITGRSQKVGRDYFHLSVMVALVKYVEYLGRQFMQSITFKLIKGEDYKDFVPDHVAVIAGPVNYKDPTQTFGGPKQQVLIRFAWTDSKGAKAQKMKLIDMDSSFADLDKTDKRKLFDPLCIDVGKEYYKSWDVPKRPTEEEIEKKKTDFAAFVAKRKRF